MFLCQTHTNTHFLVIAIQGFLSQAFLRCHGDSWPCSTSFSYSSFCAKLHFFCPGKWNHLPPPTLKPSLLFRHRCAAAATAFFFFLSLFCCAPIQESLSHADTLFCSIYVSLLPLWSKSITDTLCFHASDDYSPCLCLYWYCFRWESCMLSGSVWGIVGNRLWQTERELEL